MSDAGRADSNPVLVSRRRHALWVRLNRPDAMNAISPGLIAGLESALGAAEADEEVRVVVLAGAGRAFCAGADLEFVSGAAAAPEAFRAFLEQIGSAFDRLEAFPKPTIAAINGLALAGGLELALCCDLLLAADTASIGDAHANFGLLPGAGGSVRLPRRIGGARAKYLMFTGEFTPAHELVSAGLVNRVVSADTLDSEVQALADGIAAKSPLGLRRMKALIGAASSLPQDAALAAERDALVEHAASEDMREGLAAFEQKRPPRFVGR